MTNEFYRFSTVTGKSYNIFSTIKILNPTQSAFYMYNNVFPVDIRISEDKKSNKKCLVFYFVRSETKEVYDQWCKNNGLSKKEEV